jgi:hypothetical protein
VIGPHGVIIVSESYLGRPPPWHSSAFVSSIDESANPSAYCVTDEGKQAIGPVNFFGSCFFASRRQAKEKRLDLPARELASLSITHDIINIRGL